MPQDLARLDGEPAPGGSAGSGGAGAAGHDLGRELFRLVARARAGAGPEMELRAAARRNRDLVHTWERSRQTTGS
ncbi:MAG: hypothetical protein ACRDPY_04465 [Streptosporangiaceae bacterium]